MQIRLFIFLCFISLIFGCENSEKISFDSEKWKHGINTEERYRPVTALTSNFEEEVVGKSRSQIIDMLGEPEASDGQTMISYKLDESQYSKLDSKLIEWLDISLNWENKVEKIKIRFEKVKPK